MRIAFDHEIFCSQSYGGISRYFVRLVDQLIKMGEEPAIFAPIHINRYLRELPAEVVHGQGIDRFFPKTGRLMLALNQGVSKRLIRKWRPDVVHETYHSPIKMAPRKVPTVITVYDMVHEIYPSCFPGGDKTSSYKRMAAQRADHVICISHSTRNDLLNMFSLRPEKVSVVHLGFEGFETELADGCEIASAERPFILFVGSRAGYKNFEGMLRAIVKSKKLMRDFDIVAFGGPAFAASEKQLISDLGFSTGQVRHAVGDDEALARHYRLAALFVYPSLYEGFGLPPLEAMAHRCPVVVSNTSSMPEVVANAGEYFDPGDTDYICAAIEAVAYSSEKRSALIQSGLERVQQFTWGRCAEETASIYRKVVGI